LITRLAGGIVGFDEEEQIGAHLGMNEATYGDENASGTHVHFCIQDITTRDSGLDQSPPRGTTEADLWTVR